MKLVSSHPMCVLGSRCAGCKRTVMPRTVRGVETGDPADESEPESLKSGAAQPVQSAWLARPADTPRGQMLPLRSWFSCARPSPMPWLAAVGDGDGSRALMATHFGAVPPRLLLSGPDLAKPAESVRMSGAAGPEMRRART